jgi:hypothetical protein
MNMKHKTHPQERPSYADIHTQAKGKRAMRLAAKATHKRERKV